MKSNIIFNIAPRLHFYSPDFRFFQNPSNTLHQSGGVTSTTTSSHSERTLGHADECSDAQLASPISHHNLTTNQDSFSLLYQPEKQPKQEEMKRNDALVTLMNGKNE